MVTKQLGRRAALGLGGAALMGGALPRFATAQARLVPITIVINQSPWLDRSRST
jgi:multiple sugar transport system substrate-binding protein